MDRGVDRPTQLRIVSGPRSTRRVFLGAAVQGLGAMMLGCGKDQGPRDYLLDRRTYPSSGGSGSGGFGSGGLGSGGSSPSGGRLGEGGMDPGDGGDGGVGGAGAGSGPFPDFGPLGEANELGVRVPEGYEVRLLATAGERVSVSSNYIWPRYPDGGATFALEDGGYIYVCNSEVNSSGGGVSSLVFSAEGELVDAYAIANGTSMNCQGGATPQGTFLTCEEVTSGRVLECDPLGLEGPRERPALGLFYHEGLAYDDDAHHIYMTEDLGDGGFYRYVPARLNGGVADLSEGTLQIARFSSGMTLQWVDIPDPTVLMGTATRYQIPDAAQFIGGEGIWYQNHVVTFTTKGDNRVWAYDTRTSELRIVYDRATALNPILSGVDAVLGTAGGELLVAEDLGDMQVVVIMPSGELRPLLQVENQASSEITGIALSPDGTRLYFSSQRGGATGLGLTYEMRGPFPRIG